MSLSFSVINRIIGDFSIFSVSHKSELEYGIYTNTSKQFLVIRMY